MNFKGQEVVPPPRIPGGLHGTDGPVGELEQGEHFVFNVNGRRRCVCSTFDCSQGVDAACLGGTLGDDVLCEGVDFVDFSH